MSPAKPATDPDSGIFTDGVALLGRPHPMGSTICLIGARPRSADPSMTVTDRGDMSEKCQKLP